MSNCPGCDSSSNTYSRCNPPVSSNCVFYQGDSATCEHDTNFKICKGNSLSDVQLDLFTEICNLKGSLVVTDIQFPCSQSWDAIRDSNEKTVHNLLLDITTLQCTYTQYVDTLNKLVDGQTIEIYGKNAIDPYVEVCLKCCGETECNNSSNLHLSEALNKITSCICTLSGRTTGLERTEATNSARISVLETKVIELENKIDSLIRSNININQNILMIINAINTQLGTSLTPVSGLE